MATNVLKLMVTADSKQAQKELNKLQRNLQTVGSGLKSAGAGMTMAVTLPILAAGAAATKLAVAAVESENLFNVSLGKMAGQARTWSNEMARALGVNSYETRRYLGLLDVMLQSFGFGEEKALGLSENLTKLAYDMSSFYDIPFEEAFEKIRSGLVGQVRPLRQLGIDVSDATIKAYAYKNGIAEQGKEMTTQEKVLARYGVIMQSTTKAQGDMARTITSPANQMRVLTERAKDLGITFGILVLPTLSRVVTELTNLVNWLNALDGPTKEAVVTWALLAAAIGPTLWMFGAASSGISGIIKASLGLNAVVRQLGLVQAAAAGAAGAEGVGGVSIAAANLAGLVVTMKFALIVGGTVLTYVAFRKLLQDIEDMRTPAGKNGDWGTGGTTPTPKGTPGPADRYRSNEGQMVNPGPVMPTDWRTRHTGASTAPTPESMRKAAQSMGAYTGIGYVEGQNSTASLVANQTRLFFERHAIGTAKTALGEQSPSRVFQGIGVNVVIGFLNGLTPSAVFERIRSMVTGMVQRASTLPGQFFSWAWRTITDFTSGLNPLRPLASIRTTAGNLVARIGSISGGFLNAGRDALVGLWKGLTDGTWFGKAVKAASSIGASILKAIKKALFSGGGLGGNFSSGGGKGGGGSSFSAEGDTYPAMASQALGNNVAKLIETYVPKIKPLLDFGISIADAIKIGGGGPLNVLKGLAAAYGTVGHPYVWGAAGPSAWDCSGLVSWVLNAMGFHYGRLTTATIPGALAPGRGRILTIGLKPGHTGIADFLGRAFEAKGRAYGVLGPGEARRDWPSYYHVPGFATGGMVYRPTLAMLGEGRDPVEGVFTREQMKHLQPAGASVTVNFNGDYIVGSQADADYLSQQQADKTTQVLRAAGVA
jgi:hypothetical protein